REVVYGNYYVKDAPKLDGAAASAFDALVGMIKQADAENGRIGYELDHLPVSLHARLREALPGTTMVDASPIFRELRTIKTPEEVDRVRRATQITEEAIDEAFARIRVGTTEKEVAAWINEGVIARGADPLYVTLGAAGRGAYGVGYPTDRAFVAGEVIRADVSARYGHYHSDLGRCCVVGSATAEQTEYYRVAYEALQAGIGAVAAGRPIGEVFAAAIKVPHTSGHPEFQRHHIGHGIGLQAHEWPFLKPGVNDSIRAGMVLAVEVPYYVYGLGGFSPEDILVVKEDGVELFSHAPAKLPVVG
ncbi:MAG: Xaa-Pro peptidase family protein, partial [Candidatus Hydrogenedentales bacterium]